MHTNDFTKMIDLAAERLGGKTLSCSDDFFAEMDNLLKPGRGVFITDKYTDRGKWMDGWESRRKRVPGHDWCVIQLAAPGSIYGVDIDTNHFLGNHPPFASVEACYVAPNSPFEAHHVQWKEILPKVALQPGSQHLLNIADQSVYTHLRLNIYPDGGVARFKVYGTIHKTFDENNQHEEIDLAAAINGAKSVWCNDMFFSHMDNLIMPGRGINMGDGWETKRNRTPNNRDWVIVQLAHKGIIHRALIDTCHFKGNYPDTCMLEGAVLTTEQANDIEHASIEWTTILPKVKLQADHEHHFKDEIIATQAFTHVRLCIFPDGGISRMRLFGKWVA
ncbi:MAG: allantoicase [Ferruginibacter sp.]